MAKIAKVARNLRFLLQIAQQYNFEAETIRGVREAKAGACLDWLRFAAMAKSVEWLVAATKLHGTRAMGRNHRIPSSYSSVMSLCRKRLRFADDCVYFVRQSIAVSSMTNLDDAPADGNPSRRSRPLEG